MDAEQLSPAPDSGAVTRRRVLVVDDEEQIRFMLRVMLERAGYGAVLARDGFEALEALDRSPDVRIVLCDLRMPRLDGMNFLERVRGRGLFVIMMSAYGSTDLAMEALRQGATDFISKPLRAEEIRARLDRLTDLERLEDENRRLKAEMRDRWNLEGFVGRSEPAADVMSAVRRAAAYPSTVLLTGESGTGKDLLARALHALSPRSDGPFVAVNCAAIPESLLESELFGHERGAFTGAVRSRPGLFEQAHGGTLLLDEIGDMPVPLQTRLLRVLEDGRIRRIGGTQDIQVDVRLVAATAQVLDQAVAAGRFREDLFYRLNVLQIHIPPLRERREDIPLLIETLLSQAATRLGRPLPRVSPEAMALLLDYAWPGNVRQLENALERAVILAQGMSVRPEDLPPEVRAAHASRVQAVLRGRGEALADEPVELPSPREGDSLSIKQRTAELERELIIRALQRTGGNRAQAARLLEISYKALVYKIRDYGIEP